VNDTHGHYAGDAALIAAATLLLATLKDTGIAGRMGGDEFVFAFVARPEVLDSAIASVVQNMACVSFAHDGTPLQVTTSIGVFPIGIPEAGVNADSALRAADDLMYQAKRAGKGRGVIGQLRTASALVEA
jgi:diguanylate cyclase (GGDEF)-like protein